MCGNISASAFSGGNGTITNPYKIANANEFGQIPDNSTAYYVLVDDIIDITPSPITFRGHLDGQGYSISVNYEYDCTYKGKYQLGGLFMNCIGAEISNVIVKGSIKITACYDSGYYQDHYWYKNNYSGIGADVEVYLKEAEIGGICANAKSSVFSDCRVGCNISWCPNSGKNTSYSDYTFELLSNNCSVGGIVGYATDCEFRSSSVSGKLNVRFINVTSYYWTWVYNNYGRINVIAGNNKCGGLVGYSDNCKIKNSFFSGIVASEGGSYYGVGAASLLGGIIGNSNNSTIEFSYYNGSFLDNEYSRSFGYICGGGYLNADQCFAICDKNSELMFDASGTQTKCYSTKDSSGPESVVDINLLSIQSWYEENLPGWDFVNVWYIPATEKGLPLFSEDPQIYYEGDLQYGGWAYFNSQNTQKGIVIEPNNPSEVEVINNKIRFKKSGIISFTIKQASCEKYKKVEKKLSLAVAKADLDISLEPSESVYGEEIPEFKYVFQGFILNDDVSSINTLPKSLCDASPVRNVGDYIIVMQGGEADNYNILCHNGLHTIRPRQLKATPLDCKRKYGSNNPTLRIEYDGFVNGDNENIVIIQPSIHTSANQYSDSGVYSILCDGGRVSKNYTLVYGTGKLTIEKANLSIAAVDIRREEGQPNPKFELEYDGFRNNDGIEDLDELPLITCEANIASTPGVYPIVLSGGYDNNYEYILKNGQLMVDKKTAPDAGVTDINLDEMSFDVYTTQGILLKRDADKVFFQKLESGIYIIRQGNISRKVLKN